MSFLITPTTELEAVNECLENIGQSPVSTIAGDLGVDTQIALNFVRKVNRELQSNGWYWNTESNYELTPNGDGNILLPSNTLSVDTTGVDQYVDAIARGLRLYDRENHTYVFTKSLRVELTVGLPFEEIPETARRYIALRASRMFEDRIDGSSSQSDSEDEFRAMAALQADQLRVEDVNVLTGSWTMMKTLHRTGY
jgi:hypothetical protein